MAGGRQHPGRCADPPGRLRPHRGFDHAEGLLSVGLNDLGFECAAWAPSAHTRRRECTLDALPAPGRIDLGIGRAPGSDPVTSYALRGGRGEEDIENFPEYLDDVAALMSARGVRVPLRSGDYTLKATPAAATEPRLWLLGSSMY